MTCPRPDDDDCTSMTPCSGCQAEAACFVTEGETVNETARGPYDARLRAALHGVCDSESDACLWDEDESTCAENDLDYLIKRLVPVLEVAYRDGVRASLKALDGHSFHDTAHDRVRRLLAADPFGNGRKQAQP